MLASPFFLINSYWLVFTHIRIIWITQLIPTCLLIPIDCCMSSNKIFMFTVATKLQTGCLKFLLYSLIDTIYEYIIRFYCNDTNKKIYILKDYNNKLQKLSWKEGIYIVFKNLGWHNVQSKILQFRPSKSHRYQQIFKIILFSF